MLASSAIALDLLAGSLRFDDGVTAPGVRPFLLSIAPALDTAFGLEPAALFPDAIVALLAEIEAGPLAAVASSAPVHELA